MNFYVPTLQDTIIFFIFRILPFYFLISAFILIYLYKRVSEKRIFLNSYIAAALPFLIAFLFFAIASGHQFEELGDLLSFIFWFIISSLGSSLVVAVVYYVFHKLFLHSRRFGYIAIGIIIVLYIFFYPKEINKFYENPSSTEGFVQCDCLGYQAKKCLGIAFQCKPISPQELCGRDECRFIKMNSEPY